MSGALQVRLVRVLQLYYVRGGVKTRGQALKKKEMTQCKQVRVKIVGRYAGWNGATHSREGLKICAVREDDSNISEI